VQPEEENPERLVGWHVVEVGRRVAHPYINLTDPVSGREVRVFIDATFHVTPGYSGVKQHGDGVFAALDCLTGLTVRQARTPDDGLELRLDARMVGVDARVLLVEGLPNELTSGSPWWVGGPYQG